MQVLGFFCMYLLRRLTPFLVSLFVAMGFATLFWRIRFVHVLLGEQTFGPVTLGCVTGAMLAVLAIGMLNVGAFHPMPSRLRFLLFPFILAGSTMALLTISEPSVMPLAVAALSTALVWIWYESLYLFWQQPMLYQPYTLQRLSSHVHVYAMFVAMSALTGIQVYLQMRFWGVVLFAGIIVASLLADVLSLSQVSREKFALALVCGAFLGIEWFVAISYLPTHVFFTGILMAIYLYVWLGVTRLWAQQTWQRAELIPYIAIGVSGFIVTIGSTLWIV